jgi:hypothetical protein
LRSDDLGDSSPKIGIKQKRVKNEKSKLEKYVRHAESMIKRKLTDKFKMQDVMEVYDFYTTTLEEFLRQLAIKDKPLKHQGTSLFNGLLMIV